jgi:hypothetical protein
MAEHAKSVITGLWPLPIFVKTTDQWFVPLFSKTYSMQFTKKVCCRRTLKDGYQNIVKFSSVSPHGIFYASHGAWTFIFPISQIPAMA